MSNEIFYYKLKERVALVIQVYNKYTIAKITIKNTKMEWLPTREPIR